MELSRIQQVLIYLLGRLGELQAKGLVELDGVSMTAMGETQYAILKASGFRPTDDEIATVSLVIGGMSGNVIAKLVTLP